MILNGEDPVFWLHPTCSAEGGDSVGQENEHRLAVLTTRPNCPVFIPVQNSEAAPSTCDLLSASPTRDGLLLPAASDTRRTSSSDSDSNISGFSCSGQFGRTVMAEVASEQMENDDPFSKLVLAPCQQRGCLANGRRMSSDPEVCKLFEESDVRLTTATRCGEHAKMPGFQRWQKVEGQRSGPSLLSRAFGSDLGRHRGQLRDLNVIQRPSLDFDKMQRYCLTRVHPTRGVSKPRVVKVKCLPGSTSSFSSLGCIVCSEFLDPSVFSFRSISQNPSIRRSSTTPSLSDDN